MNIEKLIEKCKNNKNTKWYTYAFNILLNYYNSLKNNSTINSKHINTIGQALNCIINDLNRIPTDFDIQNMKYNMNFKLNNGTSNVLSMASGFINRNHVIINDLIEFWVKHRYNIVKETSSNSSTNQETYSSDDLLSEWSTEYDDLVNHCMDHKKRDKKWYLISYYNLSNYHKKLKTNKTSIYRILALIEGLFYCMLNKRPNYTKDTEHDIAVLKSKIALGSKFQSESKLDDAKIFHMNVIFNDWVYLRFTRYKNISSVKSPLEQSNSYKTSYTEFKRPREESSSYKTSHTEYKEPLSYKKNSSLKSPLLSKNIFKESTSPSSTQTKSSSYKHHTLNTKSLIHIKKTVH